MAINLKSKVNVISFEPCFCDYNYGMITKLSLLK